MTQTQGELSVLALNEQRIVWHDRNLRNNIIIKFFLPSQLYQEKLLEILDSFQKLWNMVDQEKSVELKKEKYVCINMF